MPLSVSDGLGRRIRVLATHDGIERGPPLGEQPPAVDLAEHVLVHPRGVDDRRVRAMRHRQDREERLCSRRTFVEVLEDRVRGEVPPLGDGGDLCDEGYVARLPALQLRSHLPVTPEACLKTYQYHFYVCVSDASVFHQMHLEAYPVLVLQ